LVTIKPNGNRISMNTAVIIARPLTRRATAPTEWQPQYDEPQDAVQSG
jgi:hypothetical protein